MGWRFSFVIGMSFVACGLTVEGTDPGLGVPTGGDAGVTADGSTVDAVGDGGGGSSSHTTDATRAPPGDDAQVSPNDAGTFAVACGESRCAAGQACCIRKEQAPACASSCTESRAVALQCTTTADCAAQGGGVCCLSLEFGDAVSLARCAAQCDGFGAIVCNEADQVAACGASKPCVTARCNGQSAPFATCRIRMNNIDNGTCAVSN